MAERVRRVDGLAGIDRALGVHPEAPVLTPGAEYQRGGLPQQGVRWLHAQFQQIHHALQGGKGRALDQPPVRRGPQIGAVVMPVGQDRLNIRAVSFLISHFAASQRQALALSAPI